MFLKPLISLVALLWTSSYVYIFIWSMECRSVDWASPAAEWPPHNGCS